jgi:hypothetical protein
MFGALAIRSQPEFELIRFAAAAGFDCSSGFFMVDFGPRPLRKPESVAKAASDRSGGKIFKEPLKRFQKISQTTLIAWLLGWTCKIRIGFTSSRTFVLTSRKTGY